MMDDRKIIKPLLFAFNEDIRLNNRPSHITDLMVLTIKSLIPSENNVKVYIDYKRFSEEIKLWKYYKHGENNSILNILGNKDSFIYWNEEDDTAYLRLIPIVLVNKEYTYVQEEIIKNLLFTTGNLETLIEGIILSKLLYLLINEEKNIIEKLKEQLINFSQVDFIEKYADYIRLPLNTYPGNFTVAFEQYKIDAINVLNFSHSKYFYTLKDCLGSIFNGKLGSTLFGKSINSLIKDVDVEKYTKDDFYEELCIYIYNLRKGRINPEALRIEKYCLPDVFQFNVGDEFYHSLLNYTKIIKKEYAKDKTILLLSTKSGIYKFIN